MSYGRGASGGSRDYNRRSLKPKPVEAGKEYEVDITEISRQGDGIASRLKVMLYNALLHDQLCCRWYSFDHSAFSLRVIIILVCLTGLPTIKT